MSDFFVKFEANSNLSQSRQRHIIARHVYLLESIALLKIAEAAALFRVRDRPRPLAPRRTCDPPRLGGSPEAYSYFPEGGSRTPLATSPPGVAWRRPDFLNR